MLRVLALFLPALIPSWRFFQDIGPSPRIEYRVIADGHATAWCESQRRPDTLSPWVFLRRLFWNPDWNNTLFMVSCAERIHDAQTPHSVQELNHRIARKLRYWTPGAQLQFRLVFLTRQGANIIRDIAYESVPVPLDALALP